MSLLTDADQEEGQEDSVKLMTVHAAKDWNSKVCSLWDGRKSFPSGLSTNTREELEEERRLFYVAVTRAEKKLTITHAATRYKYGSLDYCEPSRFLEELPQNLLEMVGYHRSKSSAWEEKVVYQQPKISRPEPVKTAYVHAVSSGFNPAPPERLSAGMAIEHQKFGYGKIVSLEGQNDGRMATIDFDKAGQKNSC